MIPLDLEAKIKRLYFSEGWKIGTIAREVGVHHSVVRRIIGPIEEAPAREAAKRPTRIDPFLPFILDVLGRHPRLRASRLYQMVRERGYVGSPDHFRHLVARHRPKPAAEAYLRTRTLPGEEAQVDWADFGPVRVGRATRRLSAFLMTLSWSRAIFLRFYLSQKTPWFLRGHAAAFAFFGGVSRVILYDNLKSAVLERVGDAIRFHEDLLGFAMHHGYEPRPVAPYRGNEKGRVERSVRYVRDSFFAALDWSDIDELNAKAAKWCVAVSLARRHPEDRTLTVGGALELERPALLPLPNDAYPTDERTEVKVGKQPYVRFDRNDYTVPHDRTRRTLWVLADETRVRVLDGSEVIADHPRSFDAGDVVEDRAHLDALVREKRQARKGRGLDRLQRAVPESRDLLVLLASRGENVGNSVFRFLQLLDAYGADELRSAVREALARGAPHPRSVRHILETRREERGLAPPLPIELPDDPKVRDLAVRPHDLGTYDLLKEIPSDGHDQEEAAHPEDPQDASGP